MFLTYFNIFQHPTAYSNIFKPRNCRIYSIIEGASLCKVSSLQLPWVSTHQHWHKLLRKVTSSRPRQSHPSYPCAVALSFIAVICAGKSNSTTGTIGAARVWLLLWVSFEFSFTQIVFRLRCDEGTSGKVLRVRGRVYPGREAINWALGIDLEPVPVSSERKRQDG